MRGCEVVNRDIVLAKMAHIQKNLARLNEKRGVSSVDFLKDKDIQDIVLLNLQAAIQGCIDTASRIVSDNNWGMPGSMASLFDILCEKDVISDETRKMMRFMVGFRNLIVHEYAELDMPKVYAIFNGELGDFHKFLKEINSYIGGSQK